MSGPVKTIGEIKSAGEDESYGDEDSARVPFENPIAPIGQPESDDSTTQNTDQLPEQNAQQFKRVLIVEDNELVRKSLRMLIDTLGFETSEVADGELACKRFSQGKFADLVLMDVNLEAMNGVRCAQELRKIKPGLAVIFLTGNPDNPTLSEVDGNDPIVVKPFEYTELMRVIEKTLSGTN